MKLIIAFAFEREVFIVLFTIIGMTTVAVSMLFWLVNRLTTSLKTPPRFRFFSFLALIAPPPAAGVSFGLLPIVIIIALVYILLNGDRHMTYTTDYWLTDAWEPHHMVAKLDPETVKKFVGYAQKAQKVLARRADVTGVVDIGRLEIGRAHV